MKSKHLKTACHLLLIPGLLMFGGCTLTPPKSPYAGYVSQEKIHLVVAVNLTDELRHSKWEKVIPVGNSLAENASILARHTFTEVVEINNGSPPPRQVDAILTPKVVYVGHITGATSFGKAIISIKMEWTLGDPTGSVVWVDTITGQGSGSTGGTDPRDLLKSAWEAVLNKSQRAIWSSRAIREFALKKYSDVAMVDATTNVTRPEVQDLCAALKASNLDDVIDALKGLRKMNAPEAVPEILPCLQNRAPNIIRDACRTLAVLGSKEIIPQIEPLLKHSRKDVRKDAQDAIDKLRAKP